ncbi:hypothetical protein H5410_019380 [Solanum commersonii]|uniref:Uncharacterized protein n=1 Tax=Solanum commersonii TaxID=4109 RepID=A0A9J5Z525_SOLCO|nr:hypothetical protein H5410_019380 [Solanum commersonii]
MRFKMKSLKTENEVDSNMKSTIRYTFVAPGAIGKGRGRGLKSLGATGKGLEKRTRSLSSSLVSDEHELGSFNKSVVFDNRHMQTPSKCTKLSSNMSSNQEVQNMKKLVLQKENMQTNISLPPSVDQVMNHS